MVECLGQLVAVLECDNNGWSIWPVSLVGTVKMNMLLTWQYNDGATLWPYYMSPTLHHIYNPVLKPLWWVLWKWKKGNPNGLSHWNIWRSTVWKGLRCWARYWSSCSKIIWMGNSRNCGNSIADCVMSPCRLWNPEVRMAVEGFLCKGHIWWCLCLLTYVDLPFLFN